jgi:hypothetical protein
MAAAHHAGSSSDPGRSNGRASRADTEDSTTSSQDSIQKVFDKFDTDHSGVLDVGEVKGALKILLGVDISAAKFNSAMKKFDKDHNGELDVDEFGKLFVDLRVSRRAYVEPQIVPYEGSLLGKNRKLPLQDRILHIYHNKCVALFVALCIVGNFLINILEKQIDPDPNNLQHEHIWANCDLGFNIIFLIELWANMWSYGGPVKHFWKSGWNVFDTIIVSVGVLTMVNILGPPLDKLKLMRAFRVFRLFKRIESLNKIIVALLNSIPGVVNAFVVMLVFFCIYAILAVELFRGFGEGGVYHTFDSMTGINTTVHAVSGRGYTLGIEYYGTFMRALYTLFQVMTGESWSEAVARPLLFGTNAVVVGFFFVSFIILTQIVLINVVVAVLLEKFVGDEPEEGEEEAGVEARLDSMCSNEVFQDMSTKLDLILSELPKLDTLANAVAELQANSAKVDMLSTKVYMISDSVADLKHQFESRQHSKTSGVASPHGVAFPPGVNISLEDVHIPQSL